MIAKPEFLRISFPSLTFVPSSRTTSGTVSFTAPTPPGSYELRYLPDSGYTSVVSAPVSVQ